MGKAEKAIRRRFEETRFDWLEKEMADDERRRKKRLALVSRVEALVPAALEALNAEEWRSGRLIKVQGLLRKKDVAAYEAGGYQFRNKEGVGTGRFNELYLLSNGQWIYDLGGKPRTFAAIVEDFAGGDKRPNSLMTSELPVGVVEALEHMINGGRH